MEQFHDGDPKSIGPYRVIGRLGSGGMGRVYLCTSPGGRRLAVKVIRPELADDAGFRARFRREVATARLVRSHVTAAVVDADTESPTPWLATIFLEGLTLSAAVEQRALSNRDLLPVTQPIVKQQHFGHGTFGVKTRTVTLHQPPPSHTQTMCRTELPEVPLAFSMLNIGTITRLTEPEH